MPPGLTDEQGGRRGQSTHRARTDQGLGMIDPVTTPSHHNDQPDEWGIHATWVDAYGEPRRVRDETVATLREVIGRPPEDLEERAPIVTRPGGRLAPWVGAGPVDVVCEGGRTRRVVDVLAGDFPLGYHTLRDGDGRERRLIVSPGRCWLPESWRAWGWTVQLYAARSRRSWGIGDLADLKALREWSQELGAEFLLVNPLHAVAPTLPQEASPYLPTTRRFRNPIYLRVEDIPGADALAGTQLSERAQQLNERALIDRDASWNLKREALLAIFETSGPADGFDEWRAEQGSALEEFAVWSAIALEHGDDWRAWHRELQNPRSSQVAAFAAAHRFEVDVQAWMQWLLEQQLGSASGDVAVLQDLPIGVDGGGADAWVWQDVLAQGVTVGAPPDLLNTDGQDWGSPPLVPWRLREQGYQPFIESIRATMAHAGGLRIDHVMGLFRLWWVPPGEAPTSGAYIRYPSEDLLDIVALESHRQRAIVVGEDLGTVEEGVREALAEHSMLSYRLLWFELDDPSQWPPVSMAAVTTHDLPTVAGLWRGADLDDQRAHTGGSEASLRHQRADLLAPLVDRGGLNEGASAAEAVEAAYRLLGRAPSVLLSATLDDALEVTLRPNMPGATERDNWRLALPVQIENLPEQPTANLVARLLRDAVTRRPRLVP